MRQYSRITLVPGVQVTSQSGHLHVCMLENISAGGALLWGSRELASDFQVGARVRLSVPLAGRAPVTFEGEVVRHQPRGDGEMAVAITVDPASSHVDEVIQTALEEGVRRVSTQVLGNVRADLAKRGVTDLDQVAEEIQKVKDEQAARQLFSADHFTERGVDSRTTIVAGGSDQGRECILWSVNLYLGLNRNRRVIERTLDAVERFGTGSGSSAPSGGMSALHRDVERRVARMVNKEKAIVFPTGYAANLGAMSTLPGADDLVIFDRESHASIIDGCKLSGRRWITFKHNDVEDLDRKLEMSRDRHPNIFVVVESAYSMSGDLCPLREIVALKDKHRFYLYVDEAHTFGFYGPGGRGYCVDQGVVDQVDFVMTTFSKATAAHGGVVAAREKFCTLLQASSRPYIFQATMTPATAATILACLDEIENDPSHAERLHMNSKYMRGRLVESGFNLGSSRSPIIPIYVPDVEKLYELNTRLHRDGIYTVVVVYPAVEQDQGRLRFIVTASHTRAQIDRTVECLAKHSRNLGIIAPLPGR